MKIVQEGLKLKVAGTQLIGYQFSKDIPIELEIEASGVFTDMVKVVLIGTPKGSCQCLVDWKTNPAVITLPQEAFKWDEPIGLSMYGIDDEGKRITTNILKLNVERSNDIDTYIPEPPEEVWQKQVMEAMEQWFAINLIPKFNELEKVISDQQKKTEEQQEFLDTSIAEFNKDLEEGKLVGATIFNGSGDPSPELGKMNDYYLNTIDDDGQDGGYLYCKLESGWTKIVKLKGESTTKVGGESFTDAPIRKMWFTTDESTMSDDTKVAHMPVVVESVDGKTVIFAKTKAELTSLESNKHVSTDTQSALIEEASFRPQSGLIGEELEDTHLELVELSKAEVIAQQRGLSTDKDHRLLSSGVSHNGKGLDEILGTGSVKVDFSKSNMETIYLYGTIDYGADVGNEVDAFIEQTYKKFKGLEGNKTINFDFIIHSNSWTKVSGYRLNDGLYGSFLTNLYGETMFVYSEINGVITSKKIV